MKILKLFIVITFLLWSGAVFANNLNTPLIQAGIPHKGNEKFVEVYGHRGDRAYAPENSMPAYQTALKVGVNWVDMDIGVTKDGEIVVYHDLWINPDFGSQNGKFLANSNKDFIAQMGESTDKLIQPYLVKNQTFKELEQYDIGTLNPKSTYSKYFPDQFAIGNTRMPSLQQVINYVDKTTNKHVMYQIEIKNDPANPGFTITPKEFAIKLYAILKKNNLLNRVEVQAFDWNSLYQLQKLDKNIKTAYLIAYNEVDYQNESNFKVGGLWSGGKMLKDYNNSLPQMVKALGGSCYEPEDVMLTKKDLDEAHKLGLKVVVWRWPEHSGSAFDPKLMDKLILWGVDGIITDDPARLNSMLAARGYPVPPNYPEH